MTGYLAFALFALTIPVANWLIGNVGFQALPGEPHLVPVGFGLMAPSGVMMVGAALVLRDVVHEKLGASWAIVAIALGGLLSWWFAAPALVIASVLAFTLSELADFAVYAPLRKRRLGLAVFASGVVGAVVDSAVFLWLAFGSMAFIEGQALGKAWMSLAAFVAISTVRGRGPGGDSVMPSVLRQSGPKFERNGQTVTPRAIVSSCEVCGEPAPYGDNSSGRLLTWCADHNPHSPANKDRAGQ